MKEQTHRRCSRCKETLPVDNFYVYKCRGRLMRSSHCKPCNIATASAWRRTPEGKKRGRHLRILRRLKAYGVTEQWYQEQMDKQGGVCAICKRPETVRRTNASGRLHIDHCHETGVARGLLCGRCNTAIGLLRDDLGATRGAFDYILQWTMGKPQQGVGIIQMRQ